MTDASREQQTEPATVAADTVAAETAADRQDDAATKDPEQLRRNIEATRSELGDTVEALTHKTDVKAQFSEKVAQRKAALKERQDVLKTKVGDARGRVSEATPEDAKRAAVQVAHTAEERPFPAIGVALFSGLLLGWLIGRR